MGFSHPDQPTALLALVDEVTPSKSDQAMALTRQLITDDYITSELKFENQKKIRNYQGVMMASNDKHPISLSEFARRYVIFDCISTRPASDPLHRTYMSYKLMDLSREDGIFIKALQGFFLDNQIWANRHCFGDLMDEFGDGSGLPPSINVNLGTQRSFQHDTVTSFWLTCLERGYIIAPEHNPLHPCNLQNARDVFGKQTGKAYHEWIMAVNPVGYREGEDYRLLDDGYKTPYHEVGRLWACFLLEDTVYDAYRSHFFKSKSRGGGLNPEAEGRFWSRTNEIFPIISRQSAKIREYKLVIPQEAFIQSRLRMKEYVTGADRENDDNIIREKVEKVTKTVVNQTYTAILLLELKDMREQFKVGTGRSDLQFANVSCEMFTMTKQRNEETARKTENIYDKPYTNFLAQFGFQESEMRNLYGEYELPYCNLPADQQIQGVFQQLSGYDAKVIPVVNKYDGGVKKFIDTIQQLNTAQRRIDDMMNIDQ